MDPRIALCQLSFPDTTFTTDVEIARDLGVSGLSVSETKLSPDPATHRHTLEAAGLEAALAIPRLWTILPPLGGMFPPYPADPLVRIEQMVVAIETLGTFNPVSIMVCTGPAGDLSEASARSIVVEGLRALSGAAASAGTRLSLEPMRESFRPVRTIVSSLAESLDLLDEVGVDDLGLTFDIWHSWDSPRVHELLPTAIERIHAVQIADYREPTRGLADRVVAGDGIADIPRFLADLRSLDYRGWFDLEIFSDDGRYGADYPDSLWKLDPREFARRQVEGFLACWNA